LRENLVIQLLDSFFSLPLELWLAENVADRVLPASRHLEPQLILVSYLALEFKALVQVLCRLNPLEQTRHWALHDLDVFVEALCVLLRAA